VESGEDLRYGCGYDGCTSRCPECTPSLRDGYIDQKSREKLGILKETTMRIYKYTFNEKQRINVIPMPSGAKILSAKVVNNKAQLWVLVDSGNSNPIVGRSIVSIETGREIPFNFKAVFLDTLVFYKGRYVIHVFIAPEEG
jgi:hypothetical protein